MFYVHCWGLTIDPVAKDTYMIYPVSPQSDLSFKMISNLLFVCNSHMFKFVKFSRNVSTLDLVINFALRDDVATSSVPPPTNNQFGLLPSIVHCSWRLT